MCRSIQRLYNVTPPASSEEVRSAALQYVRKITGSTKPSQANSDAFARAVEEVTRISERLLADLVSNAAPQDRELAAARRREARTARVSV
jgi:hypothetical protein